MLVPLRKRRRTGQRRSVVFAQASSWVRDRFERSRCDRPASRSRRHGLGSVRAVAASEHTAIVRSSADRGSPRLSATKGPVNAAVLLLRILVGGLLLAAGALKVGDPSSLAASIAAFRLLPAAIVGPLALALPYLELLLGAYLVLGLFTRIAAALAAGEFFIYAGAIASAVSAAFRPAADASDPRTRRSPIGRTSPLISHLLRRVASWRTARRARSRSTGNCAAHEPPRARYPYAGCVVAIVVAAVLSTSGAQLMGPYRMPRNRRSSARRRSDKTAPQFEVATTAGYFDLSKTRKPVFLEIFATWCPHCQREAGGHRQALRQIS